MVMAFGTELLDKNDVEESNGVTDITVQDNHLLLHMYILPDMKDTVSIRLTEITPVPLGSISIVTVTANHDVLIQVKTFDAVTEAENTALEVRNLI